MIPELCCFTYAHLPSSLGHKNFHTQIPQNQQTHPQVYTDNISVIAFRATPFLVTETQTALR
jgi:hypothetical protein